MKALRREKGLTQEQLAERLCVSGRTVSRWETGNNMPDLGILVEIADFYDVDIREIINGERKSGKMEEEMKDTLEQVAEYSNEEKKNLKRKMMNISSAAVIWLMFALLLAETDGFGGVIPAQPRENLFFGAIGFALAILVLNLMYQSGLLDKIRTWAQRKRKK